MNKTTRLVLSLLTATTLFAQTAPIGFEEKELKPIGGKILVPDGWHLSGGMTENGFMYVLSKENNPDGTYQTGFRIQGILKIREKGLSPLEATVYNWKRFKDGAKEVIKVCDEEDVGLFKKTCLETIETNPANPDDDFHIIYSFFWNDEMDMIITGIFGAPESEWEEAEAIYYKIKDFTLFDIEDMETDSEAKQAEDGESP